MDMIKFTQLGIIQAFTALWEIKFEQMEVNLVQNLVPENIYFGQFEILSKKSILMIILKMYVMKS